MPRTALIFLLGAVFNAFGCSLGGGMWPFGSPPPAPRLDVVVDIGGMSSLDCESMVLAPVEASCLSQPEIVHMQSVCDGRVAHVALQLRQGADPFAVKSRLLSRLASVQLPKDVRAPWTLPVSAAASTDVLYRLTSDERSPVELRQFHDTTIARELTRQPGVADVVACGGAHIELHVRADPRRMAQLGVEPRQVMSALRGVALADDAAGFLVPAKGLNASVGVGELAELVISAADGLVLRVRDVAEVVTVVVPPVCTCDGGSVGDVCGRVRFSPGNEGAANQRALRVQIAQLGASTPGRTVVKVVPAAPAPPQVELLVLGDDLEALGRVAEEAAGLLGSSPGVQNVQVLGADRAPSRSFQVDRHKAARLGVDVSSVASATLLATHGVEVLSEPTVLLFLGDAGDQPSDLLSMPITTHAGAVVTLGQVVSVQQQLEERRVMRWDGRRYLVVRLQGVPASTRELQRLLDERLTLPPGVAVLWLAPGSQENLLVAAHGRP